MRKKSANHMCEKRLISKIYKTLIQIKTNKKTCIKNGENMWIDTFQRWHPGSQKTQKKLFNITNRRQRNINQTRNPLSPHNCWDGICPRDRHQVWSRVCRQGDPVHCWWECTLVQHLWQRVWRFLEKWIQLPHDPVIALGGFIWRTQKHYLKKIDALPCSLQHSSQEPDIETETLGALC